MTSWYSNILTTTSTRITNLRSTLLGGDADGDTEDDTHVCRVLRSYYTEQGRSFPQWLPPDPKAPPPAPPVYAQPTVGSRYGGMTTQPTGGGPGTGLASLWESNPVNQRQDANSLRQGRGAPPPVRAEQQGGGGGRLNPFARGGARDEVQARPLPSQRAGSYQSAGTYGRNETPPGQGGSAQDRLKNRLLKGGARSASPATQSPFPPPAGSGGGAYGRNSGGGRSGGSGDYEDRFAPGGMYDAGGGGGGSGGDKPFVAANAPWASDENEFAGGGGRSSGPRRMGGLPSGPRMR